MSTRIKLLWNDNRWYFLFGSILLLGGALIGFFQAEQIREMAENMMGQIRQIAESIRDNNSVANTFWVIFLNNVRSSLLMLFFGCFFAIFPISALLANGVLLGYVLQQMDASGLNWLQVFAISILPHGILELPAVVFAASLGIRYGVMVIRSISLIWRKDYAQQYKQEWLGSLSQLPLAVILIVVVLLLAALVESIITPILIQTMFDTQIQMMK